MGDTYRSIRDHAIYLATRALFAVGARLPLRVVRALGAGLGAVSLALAASSRRVATANLALAFPELDEAARRRLLRRAALHLGQTFGEVMWLSRAPVEQVTEQCSISGVEHVEEARAHGRGAVLFTAHCGNWELLNAILNISGIPMTIAVRELRDQRLSDMATAVRARFGSEVIPRGRGAGRRLAQALAANRVDGLLIDQDIRSIPGVFVPFFGRPAWTPNGGGALAVRARCPAVTAFIHRRPDGSHHVNIQPLATPTQGSQEERILELTATATAAIERQIRDHPEQWVWLHRRWRTRPEDVEPVR